VEAFIAFIPLSNWLRGFERYANCYSKVRIAESRFPDAFYMLREDEPWAPGLEKAQRLVRKLGRRRDRVVALRAVLPVGAGGMQRNEATGTGIGWRWPAPEVPLHGVAWVNEGGGLMPARHEELTAEAFQLEDCGLLAWHDCQPRSFSVLPVARACQARCAFCFSKASVSDLARQPGATLEQYLAWADAAKERGAQRAVITGGGEPTLLPHLALRELVSGLAARFAKTLLITNGARIEREALRSLREAGLTTLAISRHGVTSADDSRLMGIRVDSAGLAEESVAAGLRTRAICVLQRGGVDDETKVCAYLARSARDGFHEVCFKELYIASLSENPWAASAVNQYCEANQVSLRVAIEALVALGFQKTGELPWGCPVFEGEVGGCRMTAAAYTEPSVGWERTHGVVRSWNVMSDGTCFASLEDPRSKLAGVRS